MILFDFLIPTFLMFVILFVGVAVLLRLRPQRGY